MFEMRSKNTSCERTVLYLNILFFLLAYILFIFLRKQNKKTLLYDLNKTGHDQNWS
jgi:preprotein translocase subunit SecG